MEKMELPKGWVKAKLSEFCTLNQRVLLDDELEVAFIPMAELPTTFFGNALFEKKLWMEVKRGYTQFQNNDVLLAKITPCFENGKATLINNLPNGYGAGSTEYFVLRALEGVSPKFLYSIVKSFEFLTLGTANMSGSVGHRRVPKTFIENYPVLLPPPTEQQEIVRIIESHLQLVDQIKSRLDALPKILEQFRQSVLASAMKGELTKEWRAETNMSLRQWVNTDLGSIAQWGSGGTPSRKNSNYYGGDIPWVKTGNLKNKIILEVDEYITEEGLKNSSAKIYPQGSVVLAMYGATIGRVSILGLNAATNQACAVGQAKEEVVTSNFLYYFLLNSKHDFISLGKGGAQPNISQTIIKAFPVSLPSVEEQHEIVEHLDNLFILINQIESKIKNAQERVNLLTQSILAKAFRGEFTEKWREENPDLISGENSAEALLKKIEEAKKATKKKR